jgi:hypothetical protein
MGEGEYWRRKADLQAQADALRTPETPELNWAGETLESLGQEWANAPPANRRDMLRCIFEVIVVEVEAEKLTCVKLHPPFVPLFRTDALEEKEDGCFIWEEGQAGRQGGKAAAMDRGGAARAEAPSCAEHGGNLLVDE